MTKKTIIGIVGGILLFGLIGVAIYSQSDQPPTTSGTPQNNQQQADSAPDPKQTSVEPITDQAGEIYEISQAPTPEPTSTDTPTGPMLPVKPETATNPTPQPTPTPTPTQPEIPTFTRIAGGLSVTDSDLDPDLTAGRYGVSPHRSRGTLDQFRQWRAELDQLAGANRDRWLFFWGSWDIHSIELDTDINDHLDQIPAGVSIVKIDLDTGFNLKSKYGGHLPPTIVRIDSAGNEIGRFEGSGQNPTLDDIKSAFGY